MESVVVVRQAVLDRIIANRNNHVAIVKEAKAGYRAAVIEHLKQMLVWAETGKPLVTSVPLSVPHDHTADYDAIIDILQMAAQKEISLSPQDFRRYVRDEWDWARNFLSTNRLYSDRAQASFDGGDLSEN